MNCIKKMKRMIAADSTVVFVILPMIGFAAGLAAAKLTADKCCCGCGKNVIKKAKKAFKAVEQNL